MTPVFIMSWPHNWRCGLWPGDVDENGEPFGATMCEGPFAELPIPMPRDGVFADGNGVPLALWCDEVCIRREDIETVWEAVRQYNADIEGLEDGDERP